MGDVGEEHIMMLPFMAQGHLIPFLALATQIQTRFPSITITILNTPQNINYLSATIAKSSQNHSKINLVSLPFNCADHGLPPNVENTESLPLQHMITLFHASTSLESQFREFMSGFIAENGRPPICVISDVFMGWANRVAESFNTINVSFTTGGGYGTAAYISIWQNLPHKSPELTENGEFPVPGFPDSCRFHLSQLHPFIKAADGTDSWSTFFQPQIAISLKSFGWLCNTVEHMECTGVEILKNYIKLPSWCIGPLLPSIMLKPNKSTSNSRVIDQRTGKEPGLSPQKCLEWLDLNPKSSVLYISFGSQNTISPIQMMELAKGLELSKKAFIWAIRPPIGFNPKGEFKSEWLPEGFEDRTKINKTGLLIHNWAPQLEILCHESIGAFLSHCGWNSVMESLSQGVPMIGWPLAAEQAYNSKMLVEEMRVCVELCRGRENVVVKEDVKNVIERVMGDEEMRKRAKEIRDLIREEGGNFRVIDEFVFDVLSEYRRNQESSLTE